MARCGSPMSSISAVIASMDGLDLVLGGPGEDRLLDLGQPGGHLLFVRHGESVRGSAPAPARPGPPEAGYPSGWSSRTAWRLLDLDVDAWAVDGDGQVDVLPGAAGQAVLTRVGGSDVHVGVAVVEVGVPDRAARVRPARVGGAGPAWCPSPKS